jgi:enterochelin esterase family protein
VGRAGFIVDNLIAQKKAKPMIIVMPAGHAGRGMFPGAGGGRDEFAEDFLKDIVPLVESRYRVSGGRANRAMAGLSMGGGQTLAIGLAHLGEFGYLGVFSAGIFQANLAEWEKAHTAELDLPEGKAGLKLLWLATGKDDFLIQSTRNTVELLKKHGFEVEFQETAGGHTWINWRSYLNEFVPKLFQ